MHTSDTYPAPQQNHSRDHLVQQKNAKLVTMPRMKEGRKEEVERWIYQAIHHYQSGDKPSLRLSAEKFGIPYSTRRGRLKGRQESSKGHQRRQVLLEYEEKSIVRWCERLDEWGHPARFAVVKGMAEAIVARWVKD